MRQQDLTGFRRLLWSRHAHTSRAKEWLADAAFWSAEHEWPLDEVTVSWPPHIRTRTKKALFGLLSTTNHYECLWVDVKLGPERRRYEVVKDAGRFTLVLPLSADGALQR